jgi:hypothetical protein
MSEIELIKGKIEKLKKRNRKVEINKARETSASQKVSIHGKDIFYL